MAPARSAGGAAPRLSAERLTSLDDDDTQALCEATIAAIIDGGGFGWVNVPSRAVMERYFHGLMMVPERSLFVARLDDSIVGAAQLVRPPRNNEAQAMSATLMHSYIAPYARGHGLARMLTEAVEESARALGYQILNLDVRETQTAAISLYRSMGFLHWGTHPHYARVSGRVISGLFFSKVLQDGALGEGGKLDPRGDSAPGEGLQEDGMQGSGARANDVRQGGPWQDGLGGDMAGGPS